MLPRMGAPPGTPGLAFADRPVTANSLFMKLGIISLAKRRSRLPDERARHEPFIDAVPRLASQQGGVNHAYHQDRRPRHRCCCRHPGRWHLAGSCTAEPSQAAPGLPYRAPPRARAARLPLGSLNERRAPGAIGRHMIGRLRRRAIVIDQISRTRPTVEICCQMRGIGEVQWPS